MTLEAVEVAEAGSVIFLHIEPKPEIAPKPKFSIEFASQYPIVTVFWGFLLLFLDWEAISSFCSNCTGGNFRTLFVNRNFRLLGVWEAISVFGLKGNFRFLVWEAISCHLVWA